MFKIRNNLTGLFSTGGTSPRWTKSGKVWKRRADVSNHLALTRDYTRSETTADNTVVVQYEMKEVGTTNIMDWIDAVNARREDRAAAERAAIERWRQDQRRRQYEELKKEFGP